MFLWTTVLTSVTGFGFPFERFLPSHYFGFLSLAVLAIAILAAYSFDFAGPWRWLYVVTAVMALYLNVFVLIVQLFLKVSFLQPLAPTQSEPPFAIALHPVPADLANWFIWVQGVQTDQPADESLVIEGLASTIDSQGVALFGGQVRNLGPAPMTGIEIAITLYDGAGDVSSVHWKWLDDDLAPNAVAPFEVEVAGAARAQAFGAYVQGSAVQD